jgi:hypothetical protein
MVSYEDNSNLTPSWTNNQLLIKSERLLSTDIETIALQKKNIWLNLHQENPELSKTELRKFAPNVYAWLYRHDRQWLNDNSPNLKQPQSSFDRVDWSVRDREILIQVKSAIDRLLQNNKPVRITVGRIGVILGLKALLEKHLDKLPQTLAYLKSMTETIEDFQIRRIEWAIEELDRQGEEMKE